VVEGAQASNRLPTVVGFAQLFQEVNLLLLALLRSNTACPCAVCFETDAAAFVFCVGAVGFSTKPRLGVASTVLNVVPSVWMHLEQRKVYVQWVLLT
jgi:hypothetical protein